MGRQLHPQLTLKTCMQGRQFGDFRHRELSATVSVMTTKRDTADRARATPPPDAAQQVQASALLLSTLVVLAFVCNTLGRGITETFAVFLLPVEQALSVSRAEITATYSIYMLVHGIAAPFAGQLIDRLGARITYGIGL
ncbi:MAG: MFS transporter, partial [Pseudomonadota bacterium]